MSTTPIRDAAKQRHPSSSATHRWTGPAGAVSPAVTAGAAAVLVGATTVALIVLRPDTTDTSAVALGTLGAVAAAVVSAACALLAWRQRAVQASETSTLARSLEQGGRLRAIVSSLNEGLVFYDRELRIVEFNPAAARIIGFGEEMRGRHASSIPSWRAIHEDGSEWPHDNHPVAITAATGEPVLGELMGIERPGRPTVWLLVNSQPLHGPDDEVEGVILTFTDMSRHRAAEAALRTSEQKVDEATEALEWQAFHDPLTGLPNRTLLLDRMAAAVTRGRDEGTRSAALFLDLDHFKHVNDSLGHEAGDHLIIEVANRLQAALRPTDLVARLGGDEFVVLIEALSNRNEAVQLADRLRAAVAQPITLGSSSITVTTSVGIAFDVDHRATTMLRDADTALYKAKEEGRDQWRVFDDSLRAATIRRVAAEQIIRQALDEDGLRVHFQPMVDLVSGRVVAAEALLRMLGPHGELLTPSSFISIAEESGLIVPLGAGVLDEACRQLVGWRAELGDHAPATVSVNVASRQLSTLGFTDVVERTLERYGIAPADLTLELTESTLIGAGRGALDTVVALHELGVRLAIDDFGTGYSSLAYLRRFPVDIVKIDRTFIDGLGTHASDTEIVKAVLALGQALGIVTVAEGVETPEQLDALSALGCDVAQGYLFSRPVPADEMATTLTRVTAMLKAG